MQVTTPPEVLSQIAGLARSGRMDEAAVLVESARHRSANDPVLAALGGAIEFHRGQFDRAVPLLSQAHANKPGDITIRTNLAEAQPLAQRVLRQSDPAKTRELLEKLNS